MLQTWRWFGPEDQVSVDDMLQAGAEAVVTALHQVAAGAVWTPEDIAKRQRDLATLTNGMASGMAWVVVESLPVSEDIKKQKGDWRAHIANYRTSMRNLAAAGLEVICYNFMPVLDWTRTDLAYRLPNGATCMRFDHVDFAVFDIHILARRGAAGDFCAETVAEAARRFAVMDDATKLELSRNVISGLPGAMEHYSLEDVRQHLEEYDGIPAERLRANLVAFLEQVAPLAEELGVRLCCHPDDPPFGLLGLPRIMSTEADYSALMRAVDLPCNGITLCSGSLGSRPDNDLPGMMHRLGDRVHFLHLRNVHRETPRIRGSFYEADHLGGHTDMVALVSEVLKEEARRRQTGRKDISIPFRPDHGQDILDDLERGAQPGYPAIGRLRGLAELRGVIAALSHGAAA